MFWETFKKLCELNNTTPNGVCAKLGLSTAAATHWKNGSLPRMETLMKLAEYFNVSVGALFGNVYGDNPTNQQENEYIEMLYDLSVDEKIKVKEYIEFIKTQRKK